MPTPQLPPVEPPKLTPEDLGASLPEEMWEATATKDDEEEISAPTAKASDQIAVGLHFFESLKEKK